MSRMVRALAFVCPALFLTAGTAGAQTGSTTAQTAAIPLTQTNWGPTTPALSGVNPLSFTPFDTQGGALVLDSVSMTFHPHLQFNFSMDFQTPATITVSEISSDGNSPRPTVTLYHPDGSTPILTAQPPTDPAVMTRAVTYGFNDGETMNQHFGSDLPSTSKFYLAPTTVDHTFSVTLTSAADLAQFVGTKNILLPVAASAYSEFTSTSGNGAGAITTRAGVDASLVYNYHKKPAPEFIPEPASMALWTLGGVGLVVVRRTRRRAAA